MPACQPLAIHNSILPDVLKFASHMTYISACLWVLGSRAWTFFMSRAYGGEGRGRSTVQQDSSDAGTGGAGGK